jgi:molybdopterin molybdotransferase
MDGYAVQTAGLAPGARYRVIGEAAAGHRFSGMVGAGEAVRIFTGAPLPQGAQHVVIQEDVKRDADGMIVVTEVDPKTHIRPSGSDFKRGEVIAAPRRLSPADVALLASMNHPLVPVRRKPVVAVISTGDELVMPGQPPRDDQIIASNCFGLKALLEESGAAVRILPIARDTIPALQMVFELALTADLIVTIGGASVGDHDLVAKAGKSLGMQQSFYKVAMRPGKPLMAGRIKDTPMIGLPGNPVSSMVCGRVFLTPLIRHMLGLPAEQTRHTLAPLACAIARNGPREHYMRASFSNGQLTPFDRQDSALLSVLAQANALLVRPPHAPALGAGAEVPYILL